MGRAVGGESYYVLKLDRTEPRELKIYDDGIVYTASELDTLLKMIHDGNRSYATRGVEQQQSAFGIVGELMYCLCDHVNILICVRICSLH